MKSSLALVLVLLAAAALPGCKKKPAAELKPEPMESFQDPTLSQPVDSGFAAPAPQPIPVTPAPTTIAGRTYVVQRGDTLWSIAARQYGSGSRWRDIAAANGIVDERKIAVGQTLVLP
jgi:nucleoid-associated protein YgaU